MKSFTLTRKPLTTLTIEVSGELEAALKEQARANGVSEACFVRPVLERALTPGAGEEMSGQPFETGYGMWAKYGSAPSTKEIDENRRDMFRHFAQDF